MSQSKKNSFIEALVNTFIGLLVTFFVSPFIYWICDVKITLPQMGAATLLFTVVSVIRNYVIRRWFNKGNTKPVLEKHHKKLLCKTTRENKNTFDK